MVTWEQPRENSIAALRHGMEFADGVEFDLKLSNDGEFVIYHDELFPGTAPKTERCIEMLGTDEV
ncbi:MAG: glycerophosphodiester phosphodiesterase family protein, partial [Candidatus Thermoplasmatota archaeon]|nr:glycerophosphodiester phosphodiesterase family protein [Candidatus Thermoplasmatota archaeon]